jgi:hypothetical protein
MTRESARDGHRSRRPTSSFMTPRECGRVCLIHRHHHELRVQPARPDAESGHPERRFGVMQSYGYTIGADSNRSQIVEADGTTRSYVYDAANRLTRETVTSPSGLLSDSSYAYDPGSNLVRVDLISPAGCSPGSSPTTSAIGCSSTALPPTRGTTTETPDALWPRRHAECVGLGVSARRDDPCRRHGGQHRYDRQAIESKRRSRRLADQLPSLATWSTPAAS